MELIVEIDYDLPNDYENFEYELILPGYEVLNDVEVTVLSSLFANSGGVTEPPFSSMAWTLRNMITESNLTSLISAEYTGKSSLVVANAHTFLATYSGNQQVFIRVIEQDANQYLELEATSIAEDIAYKFGQLPKIARLAVQNIHVYEDIKRATTYPITLQFNTTIIVGVNDYVSDMLYSASKLAFASYDLALGWVSARSQDPTFISYLSRERYYSDHAESFPAWLKVHYFTDWMNDLTWIIGEVIPNRLDYYDSWITNDDLYPAAEYHSPAARIANSPAIPLSQEVQFNHYINLYPNASDGRFNLDFVMEEAGDVSYQIIDMGGRLMNSQKQAFGEGKHQWSINESGNLSTGIYTISIASPAWAECKRIIIR